MGMIQSIDRAFDVLEALAQADDDLSVSELSEQLDLPLATVHRLLSSLAARGYVTQEPSTRRYGPGPRLLEIAARAAQSRRFDLIRIARAELAKLTAETGETSNLIIRQGDEAVYQEQIPSPHLVRMFTEVGQRAPLYCTGGGKAILAALPAAEFERYLASGHFERWTNKTITDRDRLRAELALARERGFALDDEEREEGVCCVAAPIFDRRGQVVGAISLSGPSIRLDRARAEALGPRVREAALACSRQLGYRADH
ncbi:transcriptional regulator, IclR family [Chloroflexus aggregans DSM 9485]|uniref:Glycerol operon regulatory protein n=2 Tax=Chloroflexus aggregans TaxID=152260 RepID=B8G7A9_CHLAD|nr:transcriptional regulator, IclR family [Chloroflexus aggregans DSM 9485]